MRPDCLIRSQRIGVPHAGRIGQTAADGNVPRELGSDALHNIDQPHLLIALSVARASMAGDMAKRAAASAAAKREFVAA